VSVIDERQAVQRLVTVCPGFKPHWLAYLDSWEGKPSGEYNDISVLADWIVGRMAAGVTDCFPEVFDEVESLLVGATSEVRNVIVIGLLEDIQNVSKDQHVDPDIALSYLGPESRKEWFFLIRHVQRDWPGQSQDES
jgi:hypothetical protein